MLRTCNMSTCEDLLPPELTAPLRQVSEHWREQQRTRRAAAARQQQGLGGGPTPAARLLAERQLRQRLDKLNPVEQVCAWNLTDNGSVSWDPIALSDRRHQP